MVWAKGFRISSFGFGLCRSVGLPVLGVVQYVVLAPQSGLTVLRKVLLGLGALWTDAKGNLSADRTRNPAACS